MRQKDKSQNGCYKKTKHEHAKFSVKQTFLTTDTHTYVCVSEGKKHPLFGKFGVLCFLVTPVLRFALLPYYQRVLPNIEILSSKVFHFHLRNQSYLDQEIDTKKHCTTPKIQFSAKKYESLMGNMFSLRLQSGALRLAFSVLTSCHQNMITVHTYTIVVYLYIKSTIVTKPFFPISQSLTQKLGQRYMKRSWVIFQST